MRLLQLRYFRDVGTTLSISKAAEMNSIPQPAMSRAIIELENELGKQLFDRVKKDYILHRMAQFSLRKLSRCYIIWTEELKGYRMKIRWN